MTAHTLTPSTYHTDMDPNAKEVQQKPRRVPIPDEINRKINERKAMSVILPRLRSLPLGSVTWLL